MNTRLRRPYREGQAGMTTPEFAISAAHPFVFGPRRATYVDIAAQLEDTGPPLDANTVEEFEAFDLMDRNFNRDAEKVVRL